MVETKQLKNTLPGGAESLQQIDEHLGKSQVHPPYGHALAAVATWLNEPTSDPEKTKAILKKKALALIEKYGEDMKKFLRPELRKALEINDTDEKV